MSEAPLLNSADEKAIEKGRRRVRRTAKQRLEDMAAVMATPAGRRVIWDLLEDGRVHSTTFVPGDPLHSAFNEGARNLALSRLNTIMAACPDLYLLAQEEARKKQKEDETDG